MAETQSFGELKFKVLSHDEVAMLMRWSLKWAQETSDPEELRLVLRSVREILPLMKSDQVALLLTAIPEVTPKKVLRDFRLMLQASFDTVSI